MITAIRTVFGLGLGLALLASTFGCGADEEGSDVGESVSTLSQSGVTSTLRINDNWGTGYCATVSLANTSTSTVTGWVVVINSAGATVNNLWSGKYTQSGSTVRVTPESYNATLAPSGSASFGFCANGSSTPSISSMTIAGGSPGTGGSGGSGGSTGTGTGSSGSAGKGGAGGSTGTGTSGSAGRGGASGSTGSGGTTGASGSTGTGAAAGAGGTATGGSAGAGGTATGGSAGAGGSGGTTATMLAQDGNPTAEWFAKARTKWAADKADIILSYQQANGGWPKNLTYDKAGNGGNDAGTFDNGATVTEIVYLAELYRKGKVTKYRDAVRRAANFMLSAQYATGGWPQFFPLKGGYADHVTFNDNAMVNALTVLNQAANKAAPFDTDVFSDTDRSKFKAAVSKGVGYIVKAQWKQNGTLTVWCAQHGRDDYKPKAARAYELESLSGLESAGILGFLMTQPQTAEVATAVRAGLAWYRSPKTYLANTTYDSSKAQTNPIVPKAGSKMWYRFYDLITNRGFFSDRDGGKYYDITLISEERRTGYSWGGSYGDKIISYASKVGY